MSVCKKCGAEIVWEKTSTGKFKPPMNPDGSQHKCGEQAKSQETIQPVSPPSGDKKFIEEAEQRVRQIVREELAKLFLNYQKASEK